jgi:hypothetical protein
MTADVNADRTIERTNPALNAKDWFRNNVAFSQYITPIGFEV